MSADFLQLANEMAAELSKAPKQPLKGLLSKRPGTGERVREEDARKLLQQIDEELANSEGRTKTLELMWQAAQDDIGTKVFLPGAVISQAEYEIKQRGLIKEYTFETIRKECLEKLDDLRKCPELLSRMAKALAQHREFLVAELAKPDPDSEPEAELEPEPAAMTTRDKKRRNNTPSAPGQGPKKRKANGKQQDQKDDTAEPQQDQPANQDNGDEAHEDDDDEDDDDDDDDQEQLKHEEQETAHPQTLTQEALQQHNGLMEMQMREQGSSAVVSNIAQPTLPAPAPAPAPPPAPAPAPAEGAPNLPQTTAMPDASDSDSSEEVYFGQV